MAGTDSDCQCVHTGRIDKIGCFLGVGEKLGHGQLSFGTDSVFFGSSISITPLWCRARIAERSTDGGRATCTENFP